MKKLILHVGLPKTATTAFQFWCYENRNALADFGVEYPVCELGRDVPKHQYIVGELLNRKFHHVERALGECSKPVLVLSTEGLSNHFYDFSSESLESFRELASSLGYQVAVFLVSREPASWLRSYYKQAVLNISNSKYEWGTSHTFEDFIALPRVRRLMDTRALCCDMAAGFGGVVNLSRYEEEWFSDFLNLLEIPSHNFSRPSRVHGSVDDGLVEMVRQINSMGLNRKLRNSVLAAFQMCFRTDHVDLALYRLQVGFSPKIFQALQPYDLEQKLMKQKLLEWHAVYMKRRFLGLGGWSLGG